MHCAYCALRPTALALARGRRAAVPGRSETGAHVVERRPHSGVAGGLRPIDRGKQSALTFANALCGTRNALSRPRIDMSDHFISMSQHNDLHRAILNLAVAFGRGAAIGFERQWRKIRTHYAIALIFERRLPNK